MWESIVVCGLEGEGNKPGETAGFVLQLAQLAQMVDPLFDRLDVPVKHRAGAAATHLVPGAMHIKPFRRAFLCPGTIRSRTTGSKISAPPPVMRTETGLAQD